jgi:hypothetical protein
VSEPVFMAQIRAADIPESMPVSRAIRDFMVAHPPTPEGQPKEELLQLLMLSVMRLEGRVVVLERRSEAGTEFLEALAEIFPKQSWFLSDDGADTLLCAGVMRHLPSRVERRNE